MFKKHETGFKTPQPIGGFPGLKEQPSFLLHSLNHLADHQSVVADFLKATDEILRESHIDIQLRRMLEFGERYHREGLRKALEGNVFDGLHTGIVIPQVSAPKDGKRKVFPGTSLGEEDGVVWGIIGARFSVERTVILDAVATMEGYSYDYDNARVVGIYPRTVLRVFFHPDFIIGESITKTVEEAIPPLRLASQPMSTPGLV